MRSFIGQLGIFMLLAGVSHLQGASTTVLSDWCVSLNGDVNTACNGAGSGGTSTNPDGGTIDLTSFDTTLSPATNTLGSVVINLGAGSNQYAAFYADYDLDYLAIGSFQDFASVTGTPDAGVSYEVTDPNSQSLFGDFAGFSSGTALPDTNTVGTGSASPSPCCDVAFALGVGGLTVLPGGSGTVTFTVSSTAPSTGFYIQQTNFDLGDSIYLSEVTNIVPPTISTGTPEPSTLLLGLGALGLGLISKRLRTV